MNYSINPIEDAPLGKERARHLLNRSLFGTSRAVHEQFADLTISQALDILLYEYGKPDPPLQIFGTDPGVPFGQTWVNAALNSDVRTNRKKSMRSWWIGEMLNPVASIREKMVLFWHNHFVTEVDVVRYPAYLYDYNELIREHATGNFKTLAAQMTINTGMLRYLDGVSNTRSSPNENYARELFELFTIGKGPLVSEGNYTYYTEEDIQEAARVLTGWKVINDGLYAAFDDDKHDRGAKTFSEYYNNQVINNQGPGEYLALIDMIFAKKQTARSIVKKLYRWFVYYHIDEAVMSGVIEPLTDTLFNNQYNIEPVLRQLLSAEHFYDPALNACYIKNPLEFILGSLRRLEVKIPISWVHKYEFWNLFYTLASYQEQALGSPPDVAGWPAYYLEPQFNELWINSATLPQKAEFTYKLLNGKYTKKDETIKPDVISLAEMTSAPASADTLITELFDLLHPVQVSGDQVTALKDVLIPGLPDFEWTVEWGKYKDNPSDANQKEGVEHALRNLLEAIMLMPEYYLM